MALDTDILNLANTALNWMAANAATTNMIILTVYPDDLANQTRTSVTINKAANAAGHDSSYGALIGGPEEHIYMALGHSAPSERAKVLDLLKATNRIVQIGPGKGKMTAIIANKIIDAGEWVESTIDSSDALGLSKALKDAVNSIIQDNKHLRTRVQKLEADLKILQHDKAQMASEISGKYRTSWT